MTQSCSDRVKRIDHFDQVHHLDRFDHVGCSGHGLFVYVLVCRIEWRLLSRFINYVIVLRRKELKKSSYSYFKGPGGFKHIFLHNIFQVNIYFYFSNIILIRGICTGYFHSRSWLGERSG